MNKEDILKWIEEEQQRINERYQQDGNEEKSCGASQTLINLRKYLNEEDANRTIRRAEEKRIAAMESFWRKGPWG